MKIKRHGLSIGMERTGNEFFLTFTVQGKLTHEDYEVITPIIDSALSEVKTPKVKAFVDVTALEGLEARAVWDDFRMGLKHGNAFEKISILGNKKWPKLAAQIGSWFIAGEMQFFDNENDALSWLNK
jgi:hypothetical protein